VLDVLGAAAPALDAEDLAVAALEHVIDQVASGEAGHPVTSTRRIETPRIDEGRVRKDGER
jgi:hypothetical protein